ncbi:MAG: 23S rRNA (uracil(1939)-C(5))-methyltransferase RlmD, partial [Bacteroidetes bacterium]|nr:23S rRNA (uracil(1939)-C(5))-methyltransferase RlmD [Bacteroidota bacterium]
SDRIRNSLRGFALSRGISFFDPVSHAGLLRNLIVRTATTGEIMVVVVFRSDEEEITGEVMGFLARTFPEVTSLMYIINEKKNDSLHDREPVLYSGNDHITEVIEGLRFRVGAKSFYQTNPAQARVLYEVARDFTGLQGEGVVYDLYCGTGTISCFVAERASKVIGIEYIAEAVNDARENALMNQIENASFFTGDIKDLLTASFFETNGSPDVVITDPPRAGMHAGVVAAIAEAAPGVIVYVSCNPATQARDILLLSDRYRVDAVQAVDMFPHTHHIENVVRLVRIDAGAGKSGGIVI